MLDYDHTTQYYVRSPFKHSPGEGKLGFSHSNLRVIIMSLKLQAAKAFFGEKLTRLWAYI